MNGTADIVGDMDIVK